MLSLQKNRINLVVFFSYNISLKNWFDSKFINRELNLYNKLIKDDKFNIWLITYGDKSDLLYKKKLNNINIIPIYSNVDNNIFIKVFQFLFFPFKYYKILKKADIYKTNQLTGAPLAIFCNILFKKKLVIRVGWEPTYLYKSWGISYFKNIILTVNSLLAYNFGNYIILTTKEIKNFICRKYLFNTKKIIIIPNYVDTKLFNNKNKTKKKNTFLNISRLVHQKNLFELLSIFSNSKFSIHIIGEGNLKISGGQRQRIGIARALYNNPEILILDEATSALDLQTELGVMNAIIPMKGTKTILIIAHRLSTIKHCDRVYKLNSGMIVEELVN